MVLVLTFVLMILPLAFAAAEEAATKPDESLTSPGVTPRFNQINCQDQVETAIEAIERQEQEARNVEKGVAGLEIAQGAVEITLGAIRIAAAGTTADVLRREDNIAVSRASLGPGAGTLPPDILGPILRDDPSDKKKVCADRVSHRPHLANDPFRKWNQGFSYRMKRSVDFAGAFRKRPRLAPPAPTPDPRKNSQVNIPSLDDAEKLLKLLEDLLDTNNHVLRLLGIDLPPITSSGAFILRQYKERVYREKQARMHYEARGYVDDDDTWERERNDLYSKRINTNDPHWFHTSIDGEEPIKLFNDELTRLKRIRRMYSLQNKHGSKQ